MILSMTGFGKVQAEYKGKKLTVEIKSLNSKQLDLSTRIPYFYREKENEIRSAIQHGLERGKVDFGVSVENTLASLNAAPLNLPILEAYYHQMQEASRQLGLDMPQEPWACLLRLPNVLQGENQAIEEEEFQLLENLCQQAIEALVAFRRQEGDMLYAFFKEKVADIERLLAEVEPYEKGRIDGIKARITDALTKLSQQDYDKNRFEQELIYYLEKLDITEEKTRLANHCRYLKETMDDPQDNGAGKGKKMGFILQEMGREINTLGSKSNQAEMQRLVVCMKDTLEQMKEQVLNVL